MLIDNQELQIYSEKKKKKKKAGNFRDIIHLLLKLGFL